MKTSNYICGVSYNSEKFLVKKLKDLYNNKIICEWYYILHHAEEDEKKDHFHVCMLPRDRVDVCDLADEFDEFPKGKKSNPLKLIVNPRTTPRDKISEWFLYVLHNVDYLKTRGCELKVYYYDIADIKPFSSDVLDLRIFEAFHESIYTQDKRMRDLIERNVTVGDMFRSGMVSPSRAFQMLSFEKGLRLE